MLRLSLLLAILTGGLFANLNRIEVQAVYPFDKKRQSPSSAGAPALHERIVKTNGQSLILWTAAPKPGQPTILYFHGNAGNLANRAGRFQRFQARGYGVIAPAYRGSSGSSGKPSEPALSRDAQHIYRHLDRLIPGLTPSQTVIYGESLGTGVALKLLAKPGTAQPAAVVLEAPYTSLPDVVRHTYPQLEPLIPRMKNIWNSLDHARALSVPLLVLHGTDDALIPINQGRQVFTAAPSQAKRFLAVKGAGHTDIWRSDVLPALWHFIDQH
ncbi:Alpha/beta hydrolase family protein [Roseovarius litorisediminis]|uniref:Alpha/beta hydrolase family protein n=1 Tax=Roseovarius litorisediminis TaxID=1312363 RepID=A0A1Y5TI43_9RHOB|nr:alpha/beta hydrolase [Roseovarius litorisediminis]SLN64613.1 Alpha/beta hydrolase family protein [Roseovarius litorisediminis]